MQGIEFAVRQGPDHEQMRERIVASCRDLFRDETCRGEFERLSLASPDAWIDGCAKSVCPRLSPQPALCAGTVTASALPEARKALAQAMLLHDWGEAGGERIASDLGALFERFRDTALRGAPAQPEPTGHADFVVKIRREGPLTRVVFLSPSGGAARELELDPKNPGAVRAAALELVPRGATLRIQADDQVSYAQLVAVLDALRNTGFRVCVENACDDWP